jgi:hypothetical protein
MTHLITKWECWSVFFCDRVATGNTRIGMPDIAVKRDPALWKTAKRAACVEAGLCPHSARKMQWATRYYKAHGGTYEGEKSADNKLSRWTREKWRTSTGAHSEGKLRYLPDEAWRRLSPDQVRRTNRSKRLGTRSGRQYVPQPIDVADVAAGVRRESKSYSSRRSQRDKPRTSKERKQPRKRNSTQRKSSTAEARRTSDGRRARRRTGGSAQTLESPKRGGSYPWMTYAEAHAYEAEAERRGVSRVARGPSGFMRMYESHGDGLRRVPHGNITWGRRRDNFVKRHMAQYQKHPTRRRYLALIMWAYRPSTPPDKPLKK